MIKKKYTDIFTFLIFLIVGFLIYLIISEINKQPITENYRYIITTKNIYDYKIEIDNYKNSNEEITARIKEMEDQLQFYTDNSTNNENIIEELYNQIHIYDNIIYNTELEGPGIRVTMWDSDYDIKPGENPNNYIIHNIDILQIINDLRASGAEIIAVNGNTISWDSTIFCSGPVIDVDNNISATPFIIEAIGDSEMLIAFLESDESVIQLMRYWGIKIDVEKIEKLVFKKK